MKREDALRTNQEGSCSRTRADRISIIRLETRAREFMYVARIRRQAENEGKPTSPQPSGEGRGVKSARSHRHDTRNQSI